MYYHGDCLSIVSVILRERLARPHLPIRLLVHCKKHHFVPNRYIYLNQSNVEAMQDIYL